MFSKKTEKANLENKKILFFEVGMVLTLAAALVAIEWNNAKSQTSYIAYNGDGSIPEEIDMIITRPEKKKEIKPPELPKIEIIENETEIEEENFDFNVETKWDENIEFIPFDYADEKPEPMEYVFFAERMPEYDNGGLENFRRFIQQIVEYPQAAIEHGLEGKVFVKFIVDKKGYVTNIEIQRGIHPLLDNEVIAAIKKSRRWKPGMQGGMPVNVAMSMPVVFRLQQ